MKARGRCGYVINIPCNWNIDGRCGADTKPCEIILLTTSDKK